MNGAVQALIVILATLMTIIATMILSRVSALCADIKRLFERQETEKEARLKDQAELEGRLIVLETEHRQRACAHRA